MRITNITIKGFRNIKQISINLKNILSFVSVNNYGKSNLLKGIDFGFDFITRSDKIRSKMMGYYNGIPLNPWVENDNFYFQIEGNLNTKEISAFKYGYEFIWNKDNNTGNKIVNEWLDIKELNSAHYKKMLNRKTNKYKKSLDAKYWNKINLTNSQLFVDILPSHQDVKYATLIEEIKNIKFNYCSLLDANPNFEPIPFHFIDEDEVVPYNDSDIPRALYFLNENNQTKFKEFKNSIFRLFPDFDDMSFNKKDIHAKMTKKIIVSDTDDSETNTETIPPTLIEDQIYQIFIKTKFLNQPISMSRMSAGTKRIFWILLNVLLSNELNVQLLAIEELETSIHPSLLKKLLEEITMLSDNVYVLISSHSTNILQYLKPNQIYIGIPNNKGLAEFSRIKESKYSKIKTLANNLGMSYGEYIFNYISQCDEEYYKKIKGFFDCIDE